MAGSMRAFCLRHRAPRPREAASENAWAARADQALLVGRSYLLLLLPLAFFSPPWLPRLLLAPRLALARSLGWLPDLAPLLAVGERLMLLDEDFD